MKYSLTTSSDQKTGGQRRKIDTTFTAEMEVVGYPGDGLFSLTTNGTVKASVSELHEGGPCPQGGLAWAKREGKGESSFTNKFAQFSSHSGGARFRFHAGDGAATTLVVGEERTFNCERSESRGFVAEFFGEHGEIALQENPFRPEELVGNFEASISFPGGTTTQVIEARLRYVPPCPVGETISGVVLPEVEVKPKLSFNLKPAFIRYAELLLDFELSRPPGTWCEAQSNVGALPVYFVFPKDGTDLLIAHSIAQATLTVYEAGHTPPQMACRLGVISLSSTLNDCLLNGEYDPSAAYARWHTEGFRTRAVAPGTEGSLQLPTPFGTGPLTFWVNLAR